MELSKRKVFALSLMLFCQSVFGATYYIDFQSGNDTNVGTSTAAPWKSVPGVLQNGTIDTPLYTNWGPVGANVFSQANKVPSNTVFMLKSGSVYDTNDGKGIIKIDGRFYETGASKGYDGVVFKRDTSWGTGTVDFNGRGIAVSDTGYWFVHVTSATYGAMEGITFDGDGDGGIVFHHAPYGALRGWATSAQEALQNFKVVDCNFMSNSTAATTDATGSSRAGIGVGRCTNFWVENCVVDGGYNWHCGIIAGEDNREIVNGFIANCEVYNVKGDLAGNDSGIGIKTLNSQIVISNVNAYNALKGFDCGQEGSIDLPMSNVVLNCMSHSNVMMGIGMNGHGVGSYSEPIRFYAVNNLIYDIQIYGLNAYAGPMEAFFIHNTVMSCGGLNWNGNSDVRFTPDTMTETNRMTLTAFNNIFYGHKGSANNYDLAFNNARSAPSVQRVFMTNDYNAWFSSGEEDWSFVWGNNDYEVSQAKADYGPDSFGHTSGLWYDNASYAGTSPSATYSGHYHCDGHSYATLGDDATVPPFSNPTILPYGAALTANYPGSDLTTQGFYLTFMGNDYFGTPRASWDVGYYEYPGTNARFRIYPSTHHTGAITNTDAPATFYIAENIGNQSIPILVSNFSSAAWLTPDISTCTVSNVQTNINVTFDTSALGYGVGQYGAITNYAWTNSGAEWVPFDEILFEVTMDITNEPVWTGNLKKIKLGGRGRFK